MVKSIILSSCLVVSVCSADMAFGQTEVKSNVRYGSVLELGFSDADYKLVYGETQPDLQYGLLWLPQKTAASGKAPLVIFVHGGCWLNEYDIRHSFPLSAALARAGYGVWSLEYRRTGDAGGGWPGSFEDIKQGIAYTSRLKDYPLDLDHMVIAGHSAGGHLALLAGSGLRDIGGIIGLAAITDIVEYSRGENSCQTAAPKFMGGTFEEKPAAYHAANPAEQSLHSNTVLLHGDIDPIVPVDQANVPGATATVVEGAGHFDWIHPGTGSYQVLLSTLEGMFQK